MKFYESLIMMRSATTEAQVDELETLLKKLVETNQGLLAKFDRWGKLKLAFPIEHKDYAYFVLARFTVSDAKSSVFPGELDNLLKIKLNFSVIRFVTLSLTEEVFGAPYKKPEAFIPSSAATGRGGLGGDKAVGFRKNFVQEDSAEPSLPESVDDFDIPTA